MPIISEAVEIANCAGIAYLHDKLSFPGQSSLFNQSVDWLLFLFGLLYLNQPGDGVDGLAVVRIGQGLHLDEVLGGLLFVLGRRASPSLFLGGGR